MNTAKLVNLVAVTTAATFVVIVVAVGTKDCSNIFDCPNDALRIQGIILLVAAIFLVTTTITYFVSFFKNPAWLRIACLVTSTFGLLLCFAGTLVLPYFEYDFWGQWLATVAATIALTFIISVSVSFSHKST
uniref:MARVEL domain-containing protein n=1 Tax=Mesocestoides corti TaxID=53468 RepID=A0A5K3FQ60_MESCO